MAGIIEISGFMNMVKKAISFTSTDKASKLLKVANNFIFKLLNMAEKILGPGSTRALVIN